MSPTSQTFSASPVNRILLSQYVIKSPIERSFGLLVQLCCHSFGAIASNSTLAASAIGTVVDPGYFSCRVAPSFFGVLARSLHPGLVLTSSVVDVVVDDDLGVRMASPSRPP